MHRGVLRDVDSSPLITQLVLKSADTNLQISDEKRGIAGRGNESHVICVLARRDGKMLV